MTRKVVPIGTGEGIFGISGDVVSVLMIVPGRMGFLTFHYSTEGHADSAVENLRRGLSEQDFTAAKLREEYSLDNLEEFLRARVLPEGLQHMERPAVVIADRVNGLREQRGEVEFAPLSLEQISDVDRGDWTVIGKASGRGTKRGRFILDRLYLDPKYTYLKDTRVLHSLEWLENDNDDELTW